MTTWCAPAARASAAFSSLLTVVTTVAPDQRASWIAALPTAPAPPATSTTALQGPRAEPARPVLAAVSARWAVTAGTPRLAPRSYDAASASGATRSTGCTVYSAAVP